ncbi:MAG: barstar family protein [Eubacteriales bacterium]|nr:barstar family protein [Eubacteriales bacterium]
MMEKPLNGVIQIDLKTVSSPEELHTLLSDKLGFPEYYGKNLDALYDCLTDLSGTIVFTGTEHAEETLGRFFTAFRRVCRDAENSSPGLTILF